MSEGLDKHELSVIERFRESHHTIARMFAAGMTPAMIRRNTGISMRRLTLMWNDPTFQELIEILRRRYNEKFDEAVDTYRDLSFGNMIESELQVQDHLAEARERGELVHSLTCSRSLPIARTDSVTANTISSTIVTTSLPRWTVQ